MRFYIGKGDYVNRRVGAVFAAAPTDFSLSFGKPILFAFAFDAESVKLGFDADDDGVGRNFKDEPDYLREKRKRFDFAESEEVAYFLRDDRYKQRDKEGSVETNELG